MRIQRILETALVTVATIAATASLPASSLAAEPGLTITATSVQVNEAGAVTVHGTSACAAGVAAYYGNNAPANLTIFITIGWTISQRAAAASGAFGRAAPCFNNNPNLPGIPYPQLSNCGTIANPCPWYTWMFDGTGNNQSFFGNGFKPGRVHVALQAGYDGEPTGIVVIDGIPQEDADGNFVTIGLSATSGADQNARLCNSTTGRPVACDKAVG